MKIPFYNFFLHFVGPLHCTQRVFYTNLILFVCLFVTDTKRMIAKEERLLLSDMTRMFWLSHESSRISSRLYQICRPVRSGALGAGCQDTPNFVRSVNPISTRGQIMWWPCPHPLRIFRPSYGSELRFNFRVTTFGFQLNQDALTTKNS